MQEEYDDLTEKIDHMKARLEKIMQEYGYKTVDEFYRLFNNALSDYYDYKEKVKKWESQYGENSLHRKLEEKQAEVKKAGRTGLYLSTTNEQRGQDKKGL